MMLLGPIFGVELVSVGRRRRYFLIRVVYALLILFVLWTTYQSIYVLSSDVQQRLSIRQAALLANSFFYSFSWLQLLAILVVGPTMAVGTIATERERRTIEYLFTTDLANHEIILGKLCARLALLGQFVLVGLPILYLFRLLGGISASLLFTTFLLAASTALLMASMSVCISVWSPRARDATLRVYLVLAAMLFIPILLYSLSSAGILRGFLWQTLGSPCVDFCLSINPIWTLGTAMGNRLALGTGLDMALIFEAVSYQVLCSIAAILWATFAVRRVHLRESSRGAVFNKQRVQWRFPRWRPQLVNQPMIWKEMFAGSASTKLGFLGNVAAGLILLTVIGLTLFVFAETSSHRGSRHGEGYFEYLAGLTSTIGSGMLLLLSARAAGLFTQEKERDTWSSLMATPLTGREIVSGKMWGNLYSLRWAFLILLFCWSLGLLIAPHSILTIVLLMLVFLLAAWYGTNVGLFFSLRSKTTLRAMGSTLATLVFTGGGYLFCCCMVISSSNSGFGEILLAPCIPFLLMFPAMIFGETTFQDEPDLVLAFILGMLGYLVVSVLFSKYLFTQFDRLSGRSCMEKREYAQ
ncbi:MAG: hypothetical protein CMJ72_04675 [Planctomycetaceae bacterium]|nr:hypothetical protein [Planctomycetaceae bacterium]HCK42643.1 hypothetical protein [Planctomycetaceae bacterium]